MSRRGGTIFCFGTGPSLNLLKGHMDRLAMVQGIGVNDCITMPVVAQRMGGSLVTWPLLHYVFTDWDVWAFCREYLLRLACPVYCPMKFQIKEIPGEKEELNKVRREAPPIPDNFRRFYRYLVPENLISADPVLPLSNSWEKGLFYRNSTIFAAINMAYLYDAEEIALLGVDLNNYAHFNDNSFSDKPCPKVLFAMT